MRGGEVKGGSSRKRGGKRKKKGRKAWHVQPEQHRKTRFAAGLGIGGDKKERRSWIWGGEEEMETGKKRGRGGRWEEPNVD